MYQYKNLIDIPLEEICGCFNRAFADYYSKIEFTPQALQMLFEKQCVRLDLSGGAFWDGEMVGFILNAQACYNGELSAFDVGTGVVPEHRGNGVFHHLLQFVECELERQQIRKYYLEVMRENESAISLYQNCGFSIVREVSVLVGDALPRREKYAMLVNPVIWNLIFNWRGDVIWFSLPLKMQREFCKEILIYTKLSM